MSLAERIPCVCLDPECGHKFFSPSFFSGGGKNIRVINFRTNCPKCNSAAQCANHGTDSEGKSYVNLNGLFSFVRKIKDVNKLKRIKEELELSKKEASVQELSKRLIDIDSRFSKFENSFAEINKSSKKERLINYLIQLILIIIALNQDYSSTKSHKENLENDKVKIELLEKQVDISKERLKQEEGEVERKKLIELENQRKLNSIEERINELLNQTGELKKEQIKLNKSLKNKNIVDLKGLCECNSGRKKEICHPFGLVFKLK